MISSFKLPQIEDKISPSRLSALAEWGLILVFCSKFYYLWGTIDYLTPKAPLFFILLRDVIIISFLLFFGVLTRKHIKSLKFFWILWWLGFALSILHLLLQKDLAVWGQHYFRNFLIPLLFYPVFYGIQKMKINLSIKKVLGWVFWLNIIACYLMLIIERSLQRPTGLFNDSLIACFMIFISLSTFFSLERPKLFLIASALAMPIIYLMSSLSAVFSVLLGSIFVAVVHFHAWKQYGFKILKVLTLFILLNVFLIYGAFKVLKPEGYGRVELVWEKAKYMYQSASCEGDCWNNWSYTGRVVSNLKPGEECQKSLPNCLLGAIDKADYWKVESTWASLALNWGLIFCIAFLAWVIGHFRGFMRANLDPFWSLVVASSFIFLIFNTIIYRLPLNILLYLGLAAFQREIQQKATTKAS